MSGGCPAVYLPRDYKRFLFDLAKRRNDAKQAAWTRRTTEVFSDYELDCLGIIGEGALASFLDVPVDERIHVHGDNGTDVTCPNGLTLSVKFNHRFMGFLMVEARPRDTEAQLYDLKTDGLISVCSFCDPVNKVCRCRESLLSPDKGSTVLIPGWVTTEDFMRLKQSKNWGAGLRHYVTCENLRHPIELFFSELC